MNRVQEMSDEETHCDQAYKRRGPREDPRVQHRVRTVKDIHVHCQSPTLKGIQNQRIQDPIHARVLLLPTSEEVA